MGRPEKYLPPMDERARCVSAYRALEVRREETVYPILLRYIQDRFLLSPEQCTSDHILDLCDISLRHILELKKQGLYNGDISRSCSGASSVVSKKVLLMKAIQEDFDVTMTPAEFAGITTVYDLAAFLCAQNGAEDSELPVTVSEKPPEPGFDIAAIRKDFPALSETVHGHPLSYLDNAATLQMPSPVMEAVTELELCRGNVHRGAHTLSNRCTAAYESARKTCAEFLRADVHQIVFTAGTTDGINHVAEAVSRQGLGGIVVTEMEHHSNFVPWQQFCSRQNRTFRVCPIQPDGSLSMETLDAMLTPDISLLAVTHCSNVTGVVNPVKDICALAHSRGIAVLVDGAQSVCHMNIDVQDIDCDFFVCSGHKLGAPFGIGLLYCKNPLPPVRYGGGMVDAVQKQSAIFSEFPLSAEAGTPNVSGAVGLAAAIRYREMLPKGWRSYEKRLLSYAVKQLSALPDATLLGGDASVGCVSFTLRGCGAFETAVLLDQAGIALRAGHHCARPLLRALGTEAALRVSPCFYNTQEEIDRLVAQLKEALPLLRGAGGNVR